MERDTQLEAALNRINQLAGISDSEREECRHQVLEEYGILKPTEPTKKKRKGPVPGTKQLCPRCKVPKLNHVCPLLPQQLTPTPSPKKQRQNSLVAEISKGAELGSTAIRSDLSLSPQLTALLEKARKSLLPPPPVPTSLGTQYATPSVMPQATPQYMPGVPNINAMNTPISNVYLPLNMFSPMNLFPQMNMLPPMSNVYSPLNMFSPMNLFPQMNNMVFPINNVMPLNSFPMNNSMLPQNTYMPFQNNMYSPFVQQGIIPNQINPTPSSQNTSLRIPQQAKPNTAQAPQTEATSGKVELAANPNASSIQQDLISRPVPTEPNVNAIIENNTSLPPSAPEQQAILDLAGSPDEWVDFESYERMSELENEKTPSVIADLLTEYAFDPLHAGGEDAPKKCPICLIEFAEGVIVKRLACFHLFCKHCIVQWLKQSHMCPSCKHDTDQIDGSGLYPQ